LLGRRRHLQQGILRNRRGFRTGFRRLLQQAGNLPHGEALGQLRPALGQRSGSVDDERVDLLHGFQDFGVLDQDHQWP